MFKQILSILLFILPVTSLAVGNLQNSDFATLASITGAGGTSAQLLNTSKIYDSTNATLLDTTLAAKLNSALNSGLILVGSAGNVATAVALSGDATISNLGALTIANLAITNGKIANSTIDLTTKVTGVLPLANGGTNKNMTAINGGVVWTDADSQEVIAAGTSGQLLQSNGAAAPSWVNSPVTSPLTTKGDIYTFDTANQRLPVGANGTVLTADSAEATGIKWAAVTGTGDFSSNTATSVDSELVLFSGTGGKTGKRATGTGYAKVTSGVFSAQSTPLPAADLDGGRTRNEQTGTTYTFALSDGSKAGGFPLVSLSNAAAITATVPTNASVAFPIGTQIDVSVDGAGTVTIDPAVGVTIDTATGSYELLPNQGASLVKKSTNGWTLYAGTQNNGITALTGDGTASGPGSAALTLATVNGNVGSFTYGSFTVNAKGLITAASSGTAPVTSLTVASANGFTGSSSGGQTPAITIATSITGILSGNGTAISAAATTGSGSVVLATSPTIVTPTIAKIANLTTNGYVKTSAGDGTLSVSASIPAADLPAPAAAAIAALDIDWSLGKNIDYLHTKTLTANSTITWSNVLAGQTMVIAITNTASNYTVTWPAAAKWAGGTPPTQTIGAKTDVITCKAYDNTNAYCTSQQNF